MTSELPGVAEGRGGRANAGVRMPAADRTPLNGRTLDSIGVALRSMAVSRR